MIGLPSLRELVWLLVLSLVYGERILEGVSPKSRRRP